MTKCSQPPILSIITVVRNGANSIEKCIASVDRFASPAVEYIVIDGGSTDGTIDLLLRHGKTIDFWSSEPDHGIYDAMNKGVAKAQGQWILFLGSDDEMAIPAEELISHLRIPGTIYYGNAYWKHSGRTYDGLFSAAKLARTNLCQQAVLYPRPALLKHPFNLRYRFQGDWELNMRCHSDPDFRFEYLPLTLSIYNDATGASTLFRDLALEADYITLLWRHFPGPAALWLSTLVFGGRLLRTLGLKQ